MTPTMAQTETSETDRAARAAAPEIAPAMGRSVGRGMTFSLGSTVFQRVASLLAQWALGLILVPDEFGVVAVATSVAMLAQVFQDGGMKWLLIQRAREFPVISAPLFWMATAINGVLALVLCAAAPVAALVYQDWRVAWNVLVIALAIALTSPMSVLNAKLSIDLRFGRLALIQVGSAVIRYAGSIGFALAGFGALSLVLPLPIIAVYEGVAAYLSTREQPWRRSAQVGEWKGYLRQASWVMAVGLSNGLVNLGPYMVIGAFVVQGVVGVYYFGYMLVSQLGSVLSNNLFSVLFPTLQKMADERDRLRDAVLRSVGVLMLVAAPSCLVLAPAYPWIERLLWSGKWAASAPVVRIVSAAFPFYAVLHVITASQVSRGLFRRTAIMTGALGVTLLGAAALGAGAFGTPVAIAAFGGIWLALGSAVYVLVEARRLGATPGQTGGAMLPAWIVAVGAALVTARAEPWAHALLRGHLPGRWLELGMVVALVGVYGVVFTVAARLVLTRTIRDAMRVAPSKLERLARRALLLRAH